MKTTKPTKDYSEVSFNYICDNCGCNHLAFFREVSVDGFKIICHCNNVIYPEIVSDIKIIYKQQTKKQANQVILSDDIVQKCVKSMSSLGYEADEAESMIRQSFDKINSDDCSKLIKYSLKHFGVNYV